jgi:hypothetical protein
MPLKEGCLTFPVAVSARYSTSTSNSGLSQVAFGFLILVVSGYVFGFSLALLVFRGLSRY